MHTMEKKAHEFAVKAANDKELNALLSEAIAADETKVGSTINAMFDLLRIYGVDELIAAPKVGSEYVKGSNDPYDKIVTTLASGKTETKWFWNIVADDLPVAAAYCKVLQQITDKEGDYAELDDVAKEEARKTATRKRNLARNAVKKAKRLFDRCGELNELGGVRIAFNWDKKPTKSAEPWTGKLANLLFPIVLQGLDDEGNVDRLKRMGADQLLSIDMAKVAKRMTEGKDAYQAIVMREKKEEGGKVVNLPDMSLSVMGRMFDASVQFLSKPTTKSALEKLLSSKEESSKAIVLAIDDLFTELAAEYGPRFHKKAVAIRNADRDTTEEEEAA